MTFNIKKKYVNFTFNIKKLINILNYKIIRNNNRGILKEPEDEPQRKSILVECSRARNIQTKRENILVKCSRARNNCINH